MITVQGHSYVAVDHHEYFGPVVEIGEFSSVAEKVTFCGAVNHPWVADNKYVSNFPFKTQWKLHQEYAGRYSRGKIIIGHDVWIGREAWIMDGVTIGNGAIIGARTMVAKDVPPYAVFVGNPGIVKKYRFTPEQIAKLEEIQWWFWDEPTIRSRMDDFKDINIFLEKYYVDKLDS